MFDFQIHPALERADYSRQLLAGNRFDIRIRAGLSNDCFSCGAGKAASSETGHPLAYLTQSAIVFDYGGRARRLTLALDEADAKYVISEMCKRAKSLCA